MKLIDVINTEYEHVNEKEIILKPQLDANLFDMCKSLFDYSCMQPMGNTEIKEWDNCVTLLTPEDITEISVLLVAFSEVEEVFGHRKNHIGAFLSRIINTHHRITNCENEYFIITKNMPNISLLCWYNSANVCIDGSAGLYACRNMEGGTVRILGNCGEKIGEEMSGGNISVKGSCDRFAGANMIDGSITVEGNCGSHAGCHMIEGNLTIKGNAEAYLGFQLHNGRIDLFGTLHKNKKQNNGDEPDFRIHGGEIHLHGEYEKDSLPICTLKGRIYHKEKCITPYHKRLYASVKGVFTNR